MTFIDKRGVTVRRLAGVPFAGMRHLAFVLTAGLALAPVAPAADTLATVFEHIDAAAKTFKGMTASISNTQYHSLVDHKDVQTGTIKLSRASADQTRALIDLSGGMNGSETLALDGLRALVYNPKTQIVTEYDMKKYKDVANQYLLLGFGATSTALKAAYDVSYVGEEKIGTFATSHIKLVPRSKETLRQLKQADLWFGDNGLVVQQKFLFPSGDYKLATYSNMKLGAVPDKELELKPKGAKFQKVEQ